MSARAAGARVRQTRAEDFPRIQEISRAIYPDSPPWSADQLASHLAMFPEGQLVAEVDGMVCGMAASLIVLWDDYSIDTNWRQFTDEGRFTNHDPERGHTLYGAEVMVHPEVQGRGVGKALYAARRALVLERGLLRVRAGARLCGYHRYAERMTAEEYTEQVVRGKLTDNTLTFQLKQGFSVLWVVSGYLRHDPESLGYAAVIEWINDAVATPADRGLGDPRFRI